MKLFLNVFFILLLLGCKGYGNKDADEREIYSIPSIIQEPKYSSNIEPKIAKEYEDRCYDVILIKCPPFEEVWRAKVVFDKCNNIIVESGQCQRYFECDPTYFQTFYEMCQFENQLYGKRRVFCDKGTIKRDECVRCQEEICDGKDNDCDGEIDEIRGLCATACGQGEIKCVDNKKICTAPMPAEEVCDGIDNDCDDEIDEHQLNACDECGPTPKEVCDGIDNDCDGFVDEELEQKCLTICESGAMLCFNGRWSVCSAQMPAEEECDGIDNDCDGQTDEDLECGCLKKDVGLLVPCTEPPLKCGQGYKTCKCFDDDCDDIRTTECKAICFYSSSIKEEECDEFTGDAVREKCNNFDDDCDGLTDEELERSCYSGIPETKSVGICKSGKEICKAGVWGGINLIGVFTPEYCMGEILPFPKDLCNGSDDNCDGDVDDQREMKPTDILFIVDWSGSIEDEIGAVIAALNLFALNFVEEDIIKWSLIIGPKIEDDIIMPEYLILKLNMSEFNIFLSSLASLTFNDGMGSNEMLYDAVYIALHNLSTSPLPFELKDVEWGRYTNSKPPVEQFIINWRKEEDSQRILIIFTDEKGQSYFKTPNKVSQGILLDLIQTIMNINIYTFTPEGLRQYTTYTNVPLGWENIALIGNGKWFPLTDDPGEMFNNLIDILDKVVCGGEQ